MACGSNRVRLLCMLSMTFGFMIVEVVVSQMTGSLTMLADSFHMLSDVIAQLVALFAMRFAAKTQATERNTFGWIRAEVCGGLVNAVFLGALCFTILMEATGRIFEPRQLENPQLLIWVGVAGLLVNLLGICLFSGHSGHNHSHSGHSHENKNKGKKSNSLAGKGLLGEETINLVGNHNGPNVAKAERRRHEITHNEGTEVPMNGISPYEDKDSINQDSTAQLNIRGVFLHVLGDFLVSVIVVINALIFTYVWQPCVEGEDCINVCLNGHSTDNNNTLVDLLEGSTMMPRVAGPCWVLYLEPVLCYFTVAIMLYFTYPLLKESTLILLQTVPKQIDVNGLNERLLSLEGVLAIHELHIWQLAGSRIIATAHVKCHDPTSYMDVAKRIKDFFHHEGIHATTIQPEFVTFNSESRDCELPCQTQCAPNLCCSNGENGASSENGAGAPVLMEVISEATGQDAAVEVVLRQEP